MCTNLLFSGIDVYVGRAAMAGLICSHTQTVDHRWNFSRTEHDSRPSLNMRAYLELKNAASLFSVLQLGWHAHTHSHTCTHTQVYKDTHTHKVHLPIVLAGRLCKVLKECGGFWSSVYCQKTHTHILTHKHTHTHTHTHSQWYLPSPG